MNILITGGCGFIGVNFIAKYLGQHEGHLRILDNLSVGSRRELESICTCNVKSEANQSKEALHDGTMPETSCQNKDNKEQKTRSEGKKLGTKTLNTEKRTRVELVIGDVRNYELVKKTCQGMDAVVHLAANTGVIPSMENPIEDCMSNVIGTVNLLEGAKQNGHKRFVLASSGATLGEYEPPIHEEMVARPISPYGASKLSGEAYCSAYHGAFGLKTIVLRFGNVYGPRSTHKGSVISKFIKHIIAGEDLPIYGVGSQTRDFIYVGDLVNAILLALERTDIEGQVLQIATQREHAVEEIARVLIKLGEKYLSRKCKIIYEQERKGEVKRNFSDISKARQMLRFEPKVCLEEGLEKTFLWFLNKSC